MIDNSKYYLNLYSDASGVFKSFPRNDRKEIEFDNAIHKNSNIISFNLLYNIIKFYKTYTRFIAEFNMYYFNDLDSEDFIGQVDSQINSLYDEIFGDKTILTQFFEKEKYQLKDDPLIKELQEKSKHGHQKRHMTLRMAKDYTNTIMYIQSSYSLR